MKTNKIITTCLSGTTLEWFDFSLFGVLSPILAELFFPSNNKAVSLLKIFVVFATGFFIRPVAALYWGYLGDKIGRKKVVILIIAIMTFSSVAIGFLPTYSSIGVSATILLILFRLTQGFSASGEHAGMLAYLYEISSAKKKSFFSSVSISGVFLGMGMAIFFSFLIHNFLSVRDLILWGWRIPFLCSSILGMIAFSLRKKLVESEQFESYVNSKKKSSVKEWALMIFEHRLQIIRGIGVFQLAVVIPYITFVYMVAHAVKSGIFVSKDIYLVTFFNLVVTACFTMFFGYIGENFKKWMQPISIIFIGVGVLLIFHWLYGSDLKQYFIAQLYFGFFTAMLVGPFCSILSESFSVGIRYTGIAVCFNISATIFGGTSPVILSLFQLTKSPILYSMTFIMLSCIIATMSNFLTQKESHYARSFQ